jgi:hypothetical protein
VAVATASVAVGIAIEIAAAITIAETGLRSCFDDRMAVVGSTSMLTIN